MLNTETMFEYYHLLTLSNGTILDVPAGRAGFLTEPHPIATEGNLEMEWPAVIHFDSPRKNYTEGDGDDDEDYGRSRHDQGPKCVSL